MFNNQALYIPRSYEFTYLKKTSPKDELILHKFISKTRDIFVEGLAFGTVNRTS